MPGQHNFEHLSLVLRKQGPARFPRSPRQPDPTTVANRANRAGHSTALKEYVASASLNWQTRQVQRVQAGLPIVKAGIPLLLKIDTSLDMEDLRHYFGFEIVSEQEDGFVIVTSEDVALTSFQQKLNDFITNGEGSASVARIHDLPDDPTQEGRLKRILSDVLFAEWGMIVDDAPYIVDVSIACAGNWQIPAKPKRGRLTAQKWAAKEAAWSVARNAAYDQWDALRDERYQSVMTIISPYNGEVFMHVDDYTPEAATLPDCFTLRLGLPGKGLKDLVLNYPYIFEVTEPDDIETPQQVQRDQAAAMARTTILPPDAQAPAVCVIDSGVQEEHVWLEPAIDKPTSHCFLPGVAVRDIADYVAPSGHGTRIAGAVIHGETVPKEGQSQARMWVQNARVLDANCSLPKDMFPPVVLREVVKHYHDGARHTRIFNHSINADTPCRTRHMSAWAAEIDRISFENDVLIVQSAGNLKTASPIPKPGIKELVQGGQRYPDYLNQAACRIANPAQSFQSLTVGSVAYGRFEVDGWRSFASENGEPSAFSRAGLGIWESIKPDVVEYGGDCLISGGNPLAVAVPTVARDCYPELVRSTRFGGPAFARDDVGTSYAAPKVTRIAAELQRVLPEESCLLYRALIAQSARWPVWAAALSPEKQAALLRRIGYGLVDMERATVNTDYRVTFITTGDAEISAGDCHIYQVRIPEEIRRPGGDYDIRVEATLSYVAEPRRTRRTHRGYLSTWVDWVSSRKDEKLDSFLTRAIKDEADPVREGTSFGWTIESRGQWGQIPDIRRSIGTLQKDWAILKSNALPDDFCIAVRGHRGWSRDPEAAARYVLAVTFDIVGQEIAIYAPLRVAVQELQVEIETEAEVEAEIDVEG